MDYEKLDKYIQYVITQVSEGNHTKEEMISDLQERGLSKEEVIYVIKMAWMEGGQKEESSYEKAKLGIKLKLLTAIIILILVFLIGGNIFRYSYFWYAIGAIAILLFVRRKKKFK